MLLAAGRGERMRPLTDELPKPLVPVLGKALIDWQLEWLADAGIAEVMVNVSWLAEKLQAHLLGREFPSVQVSFEPERLETGGGIVQALPFFGQTAFFSVNSDVIMQNGAEHPLLRMAKAWDDEQMDGLLLLQPIEKAIGYTGAGDFFIEDGKIRHRGAELAAPYVYTGVQMLHPRLFADAPEGAFSMVELYKGKSTRFGALVHDGGWMDVGTLAGIKIAEDILSANSPLLRQST